MTNADIIRNMSNDELVDLIIWNTFCNESVPDCSDNCDDFGNGCAEKCTNERRERAVREFLEKEVE